MQSQSLHLGGVTLKWLGCVFALVVAGLTWAGDHIPLVKDGLHDPANPSIKLLQEPNDALSQLPPDVVGSGVLWVKALEQGIITPRSSIFPNTKINKLDLDVILPDTGEMPMVRFPHRQHTEWLDCTNCHDSLFAMKKGGTKGLNMFAVLQGEYCGLCHGAVSFPLTECKRCHSVYRK
jgi:c(7)-type cytochrome triheme protein